MTDREAAGGVWFSGCALAAAMVAFVVSLDLPWVSLTLPNSASRVTVTAVTGVSAVGSAAYQLYLVAVPVMLALGIAGVVPGRHRAALRAASGGFAIAIGIGLIALLAGLATNGLGHGTGSTAPVARAGFYVAFAVALLAVLAATRPIVAAIRVGARGRVALGALGVSIIAYALALWMPWLSGIRIDDLPFGTAYACVAASLLAGATAACVTRSQAWRLGTLVLGGCWTVIGVLVVAEPSWIKFGNATPFRDFAYSNSHRAAGVYLGVVALIAAVAAAWVALPGRPARDTPTVAYLTAFTVAGFVASVVLPWVRNADLGHIGILAGAGEATGPVNVLFLVMAPLLVTGSAVACATGISAVRCATAALAGVLLVAEAMIIVMPERFTYVDGRDFGGTISAGAYAAVAMTLLAAGLPWVGIRGRTEVMPQRPPVTVRAWMARLTLAGTAVLAVLAVSQPWIHTRLIDSDDAEFEGDILRSPMAFVILACGVLLLAAITAVIIGGAGPAAQVGALGLATGYAAIGWFVHAHATLIGYPYQLILAVGATFSWRPGWYLAIIATVLAVMALLIQPWIAGPQTPSHHDWRKA